MVEVEHGKRSDRPVLRKTLDRCRVMGATLLVAKLDCLARNRSLVGTIMASGVPVEFCNIPASKGATGVFPLGVMVELAQLEAGLIGERTKAALAAARERGVRLGVTAATGTLPRMPGATVQPAVQSDRMRPVQQRRRLPT